MKNQKIITFILLPLLLSIGYVGYTNSINANNLELNTDISGSQLFPTIGYAKLEMDGSPLDGGTDVINIGGINMERDTFGFYTWRLDLVKESPESRFIAQSPIVITHSIDAISPLLVEGLVRSSVIEGNFLFFEPSGSEANFVQTYNIEIIGGTITSVRSFTVVGANGVSEILEEISFAYSILIFTDIETSISYEYSSSGTP